MYSLALEESKKTEEPCSHIPMKNYQLQLVGKNTQGV